MTRHAPLVLLALCAGQPLHAQWRFEARLGATRELVQSRASVNAGRYTGSLFGGEALVTRRQLSARLRYAQGRVSSDSAARGVTEGAVLLGYAPRSWLGIWLGPEARTFTASGLSDRRWLFWTARVRAGGAIFPGRLDSFVEAWHGLSGRLSRPATSASGGGVELGFVAGLPGKPFSARISYRVEQGRASGGIKETVEAFTLAVGYQR